MGDLNLQTSAFNNSRQMDNCSEYSDFLDELKKLHEKVDSNDLSGFKELKL